MLDLATTTALPTDRNGVIRDGASAIILDGELVVYDAADWRLREGDEAVVLHNDGRVSIEVLRDTAWGSPLWAVEDQPRRGMIDDNSNLPPGVGQLRMAVIILGRLKN